MPPQFDGNNWIAARDRSGKSGNRHPYTHHCHSVHLVIRQRPAIHTLLRRPRTPPLQEVPGQREKQVQGHILQRAGSQAGSTQADKQIRQDDVRIRIPPLRLLAPIIPSATIAGKSYNRQPPPLTPAQARCAPTQNAASESGFPGSRERAVECNHRAICV